MGGSSGEFGLRDPDRGWHRLLRGRASPQGLGGSALERQEPASLPARHAHLAQLKNACDNLMGKAYHRVALHNLNVVGIPEGDQAAVLVKLGRPFAHPGRRRPVKPFALKDGFRHGV